MRLFGIAGCVTDPSFPGRGGTKRCGRFVHRRAAQLLLSLAVCLCLLLLASSANAEPKFPPLTGRVVDAAHILTPTDKAAIEADLRSLEEKSSDQIVVYTTSSLQGYPIEDFGYQLGRAWGIGQKGTNNGVILIVAPTERKVRIEVGRGLEPQLTDLLSKLIIENSILPAFRKKDFSGGVKAGVRDIRDALLGNAEEVKQRAAAHRAAARRSHSDNRAFPLVIFVAVFFVIILVYWLQSRSSPGGHYRRTPDGDRVFIPGGGGSHGGWSGGGGGSGGDSGWSGGGGDFGGGGASGDW